MKQLEAGLELQERERLKKIESRKKRLRDRVFKHAGLDEMWTYVGKRKNDVWIWTAVFDKDLKFFEVGKRDESTFWEFYYQIPMAERIQTDGYKVYENLGNREVNKYGYTNWNEGLHSFLRSKLAMLKRKTKAYAKSIRALYRALALVFIRWNLLSTY